MARCFTASRATSLIERRLGREIVVPARDVLHIRLHTPNHPLIGETPLQAAALDVATSGVIGQQQVAFYANQARPSFILSSDKDITTEQAKAIRQRWDEQAAGFHAGETAIMSHGLKPIPVYTNAQDSQLADVLKLSDQHIALVFRVPLQVLGIGGTPFASTEALMQSGKRPVSASRLNHIEEAFGQLFGLAGQPEEYVEFDTGALLRSSRKELIEALAAGVHGGLIAPNEGRAELEYAKVEYGDEPRLQQQDVPLSRTASISSSR
jgi:HK97 family phage portal protein